MKKIIALMFILATLFVFVSCGNSKNECEHVDKSPADGVCDICDKNLNIDAGDFPIVPAW